MITFHQSLDRLYRKVADGTVFDRHDQAVEPPSWDIIAPPFTDMLSCAIRSVIATCNDISVRHPPISKTDSACSRPKVPYEMLISLDSDTLLHSL